jgi:hypothetical protein
MGPPGPLPTWTSQAFPASSFQVLSGKKGLQGLQGKPALPPRFPEAMAQVSPEEKERRQDIVLCLVGQLLGWGTFFQPLPSRATRGVTGKFQERQAAGKMGECHAHSPAGGN